MSWHKARQAEGVGEGSYRPMLRQPPPAQLTCSRQLGHKAWGSRPSPEVTLCLGREFPPCQARPPVSAGLHTVAGYESQRLERPRDNEPAELDGKLGEVPNGIHMWRDHALWMTTRTAVARIIIGPLMIL